jgi:hypothetical protein
MQPVNGRMTVVFHGNHFFARLTILFSGCGLGGSVFISHMHYRIGSGMRDRDNVRKK